MSKFLENRKFKENTFWFDVKIVVIALAWWDWDHERLAEAVGDMRALAPEEFLARHETQG